ncbi:glycoside hydrolase family 10 [Candidatus Laterigemmans baculatus]|uniref:glycoside hydrolase family 10 n=1 Tax=Candidatus Laterigemmans baculatus TaxID=2770505 RepID=UPI0013D9CA39|nr:glycoside hydrolase family 10 [Candidatus Laterigemmans baculatus]
MGQFRFTVPPAQREGLNLWGLDLWNAAYVCGSEGIPWEGRVGLNDGILTIQRTVDDSGRLYIPYPVAPGGPLATLSTCSLPQTERPGRPTQEPRLLPLELARGECFRLRNQADLWRRAGLQSSAAERQQLQTATDAFLRAASHRGAAEEVGAAADVAIHQLYQAGEQLVDCYSRQAIEYRQQTEGRLATLLGANVAAASAGEVIGGPLQQPLLSAFNTVQIPLGWGTVETDAGKVDFAPYDRMFQWAMASGLRTIAGPLLDFRPRMLPHWSYLVEDDFISLVEAVESYVERAVLRYHGRVTLWHATAGLNTPGPMTLDEEQVMRLAVAVIHTIRRVDPRTPVLISVDQPWGEYLARERDGISPLHFADALIRSNLGVAGIGLEMRMNYTAPGSLPRSLLDLSQHIDRWASLGLPLLVQLAMPASGGTDPLATQAAKVIPLGPEGRTTPQLQAELAARWVRALIAKGVVHGIVWDSWDDRYPHSMPHAGLIDPSGKPRPLLDALTALRKKLLT